MSTCSDHCTESYAVEEGSFIPGVCFFGFSLVRLVWSSSKYSKSLLLIFSATFVCVMLHWRSVSVSNCDNPFCNRKKVVFFFNLFFSMELILSLRPWNSTILFLTLTSRWKKVWYNDFFPSYFQLASMTTKTLYIQQIRKYTHSHQGTNTLSNYSKYAAITPTTSMPTDTLEQLLKF